MCHGGPWEWPLTVALHTCNLALALPLLGSDWAWRLYLFLAPQNLNQSTPLLFKLEFKEQKKKRRKFAKSKGEVAKVP